MAKVALAIEKAKPTGIKPTEKGALSAADEYQFKNDGNVVLRVKNASAEATNVTIVTPGTQGNLNVEDQVVAVAAGESKIIGPFDTALYNDAQGLATVKFSKVANITVETVKV